MITSSYKMKNLYNPIFLIAVMGFLFNLALPRAWAYEPVLINNSAGQPVFQYNYFAEGEPFRADTGPGIEPFGAWSIAQNQKKALERAGQFWVNAISPRKSPVKTVIFDVMPISQPDNVFARPEFYFFPNNGNMISVPAPESILAHGQLVQNALPYHAMIEIGVSNLTSDLNGQQSVMPFNLESVMIHELGHSLGILSTNRSDPPFTIFEDLLDDSSGRYYFTGQTATLVYGDGKSPQNIPMEDSDPKQDQSHFGLRNTLMTHRLFRNYASFVEAEMASLLDIGYDVDLRNYFGRSIYTDGNNITNNQGFGARNEAGTAYLANQPNLSPYGLGLHIYGDNNTVFQNADILADGPGGGGIRSDGLQNTIIVNPGVKVTANGARGTGLLVAYGHDSQVVNRGTIQATGPDGDAVRFDMGVNINDRVYDGNGYGNRAQYSYYDGKDFINDVPPNASFAAQVDAAKVTLNGPLVARFDVTGSITGSRSAIYIGGNSHVGAINVMNGASIQGRIINDYYYHGQKNTEIIRSTKLTFGLLAAADGLATESPDPNFSFTIGDDILGYGADNISLGYQYRYTGRGLFDVGLEGGQTAVNHNAAIMVNKFTVKKDAALLGQADFGFGRYTKIQANAIDFQSGSFVGIDSQTLNFGPSLAVNQNYPLVGLELLKSGGTFSNSSTPIYSNGQPVMVGINDYSHYQLNWNDDRKMMYFQPTGPGTRNSARAGDAATSAPLAGAVYDQGWSHILNRPWAAATRYGRSDAAPAAGEAATADRLWGGPIYSYTHSKGSGDRAGYNLSAPGLALGVDHSFDNELLAGLAFSLAWPESKSDGMKNKATSWTLATYAGYELPGQVEIGAALGLGRNNYELTRQIKNNIYDADYSSRTLRAGLSLGRPFDLTPELSLRPRLLGDYLNIKVDGYKESAGPLALVRENSAQNVWRTELLAELFWQSETGSSMGGSLGWARLYGDRKTSVQSFFIADAPDYNFFKSGTPLDRDSLTVGLTSSLPIADGWAIEADYNGIFGRTSDSHSGELKAVFSF